MFTWSILIVSIVMILCIVLSKISGKLGVPALLAFIVLGMLFGSDGIVKIPFDNYVFAEQISTVALIFIMFYGGFGTRWKEAKKVAGKSILLSTIGVVLTALFTGLFCYLVLKMKLLESFLTAAVISSTDAASVFSILRSKKLNLKDNTASLLELESGSNDPCAYMLMVLLISLMKGSVGAKQIVWMFLSQVIFAILPGIIIAKVVIWLQKRIHIASSGIDAVFVCSIALFSYALASCISGNGFLCVYLVGIILGNTEMSNKRTLVPFFDGITNLMQMLLFFLLGLISFPAQMPKVFFLSVMIAVFMTLIGRPLAVMLILTPFRCNFRQQLLVSWAGLRGAASIVFAIMAMNQCAVTEYDILHIVYMIVFISILLQGTFLPLVAKKLDMIDYSGNVMKTFTDYSDEIPIQFIEFEVNREHAWVGRTIQDILLPPDTILVLLQRGNEKIVPGGNTRILEGDRLILSAKAVGRIEGIQLGERKITSGDSWEGQYVRDIRKKKDLLIMVILRDNQIIIPNGSTRIYQNDILVLNVSE